MLSFTHKNSRFLLEKKLCRWEKGLRDGFQVTLDLLSRKPASSNND